MTQPCKLCKNEQARLVWQTFANDTRHIRAECVRCGAFIQYITQTDDAVNEADNTKAMDHYGNGGLFK